MWYSSDHVSSIIYELSYVTGKKWFVNFYTFPCSILYWISSLTSGPARGISNDRKPLQHNVREPTFQVFNDENQSPTVFPPQSGEWGSVPGKSGSNRENEQQPGKWTEAKVHLVLPLISVAGKWNEHEALMMDRSSKKCIVKLMTFLLL